ncbi:MAG: ATP-binding protein, partial [Clostridiaceae bacterium]|nr:ATP-binding protein [Clostridiaceae bacterium]
LGEVPLVQYEVMMWIKEYIDEGIKNIFGGLLDEIIG